MVIKDLLNKVSKPNPDDPQVKQLRDKLAKLQEKKGGAKPQAEPAKQPEKPAPAEKGDSKSPKKEPVAPAQHDEDALAKASAEEQRRFAQNKDPSLRLREERTQKLMAKQISEMIELTTEFNKRLSKLESEKTSQDRKIEEISKRNEEINKRMQVIDQRLEKFMGLYEVVTNQYNPFADKQTPQQIAPKEEPAEQPTKEPVEEPSEPSSPAATVAVSDNLTGDEQAVEFSQGRISSENARKMQQLLEELERDEREKQDLADGELDALEVKEEKDAKAATAELESLLGGFEERLKGYLDENVQSRLHETFTRLEGVLNEEIQSAVKEEVDKLKQTDDILEKALLELEELSAESSAPEEYAAEERSVAADVRGLDAQIKAIPPSLYFRLKDGRVLKSKQDLIFALQTMPDATFSHHVRDDRNDFADWLELALEDPQGKELRGKSREEMRSLLQNQ